MAFLIFSSVAYTDKIRYMYFYVHVHLHALYAYKLSHPKKNKLLTTKQVEEESTVKENRRKKTKRKTKIFAAIYCKFVSWLVYCKCKCKCTCIPNTQLTCN